MAKPAPTAVELVLLKLFWRYGPLSAREVHDRMPADQRWSISTTRTVLDRMRTKGLLSHGSVHGVGVYEAAQRKVLVLGRAIRSLTRGILEVDGDLPINAFSGSALLSAEELEELAALVNAPGGESDEEPDEQ